MILTVDNRNLPGTAFSQDSFIIPVIFCGFCYSFYDELYKTHRFIDLHIHQPYPSAITLL